MNTFRNNALLAHSVPEEEIQGHDTTLGVGNVGQAAIVDVILGVVHVNDHIEPGVVQATAKRGVWRAREATPMRQQQRNGGPIPLNSLLRRLRS